MGQNIIVTGIVLSAAPIGENDKRLVILTKELGKISAFAKGARRPTSSLLAPSNPFAFGEFELYRGRNSYTVHKADISNYFMEITKELETAYYGFYFLEICDYYTLENNNEKDTLILLYQSLRALCKKNIDNRLVRRIFELKLLVINGEYPELFQCGICKNDTNINGLSVSHRAVVCDDCQNKVNDYYRIEQSTLYSLQYIILTPANKLFSFAVSPKVLSQIDYILENYMQSYVDKRFNSLKILDSIIH